MLEPQALPYAGATVLLVEDDSGVRIFARQVLAGMGFTVLEAASGPDALAIATRHPSPINLLVTDMLLPGFGGGELAKRLAEIWPGLAVLFLSGYTEHDLGKLLPPGAVFQEKPFFPSNLQQKVRLAMDR